MAWITPKTDWSKTDKFTYTDYNRIRNNLLYINDELNQKYPDVAQTLDLGNALDYSANYYPSQFNAFEDALESFKRIGKDVNIGSKKTFHGNTAFIDYKELNRLENCCLRWYNLSPTVQSVVISPNSFELNKGDTIQLTAIVEPADAEYTITWSSSDNNVATVDQNGLVTASAVRANSFIITATVSQTGQTDKTATANGAVLIPVTGLSLLYEGSNIEGDIIGAVSVVKQVKVNVTPSNATHAKDWTVEIGRGQYGDVATKVYKSSSGTFVNIDYQYSEEDYPWSSESGYTQVCNIQNTKHVPVTVSLDGFTQTFYITLYPNGTYGTAKNKNVDHNAVGFRLIKKGSSATDNVHLNYEFNNFYCDCFFPMENSEIWYGWIDNYDDRQCSYRDMIEKYSLYHFSDELKNALKSFTKVVYTAKKTTGNYSSKYHILSLNEIGGYHYNPSDPDASIPTLGNDTYPYIISSKIIYLRHTNIPCASRSRGFEEGFDDIYPIGMADSTIGTYYNIEWSDLPTHWNLYPIINISGNIRVKFLRTYMDTNIYEIDWTGQSTLRLYDVPLGSEIVDLTGHNARKKATAIIVKDNGVTCTEITLAKNESKTLTIEISPLNKSLATDDVYINYSHSNLSVVRSGNTVTITKLTSGGDIGVAFIIDDATWYLTVKGG